MRQREVSLLGAVLSHGYLIAGILPAFIAFPTLAMMLLGPGTNVCTNMLNEAFLDFITNTEKQTFKFALGIDNKDHFPIA